MKCRSLRKATNFNILSNSTFIFIINNDAVEIPTRNKRYSLEEYFALEEKSAGKHEFHNGKIVPMSGGSIPHNKIAGNILVALEMWIEANDLPFVVLNSDTKIRIDAYNRSVYPDVLVVCEKLEFWGGRKDIIVNPTLIVEVTSDSTEHHDRDNKFALYRSLTSFKEYILVNQYKPQVESFYLQSAAESLWKITAAEGLSSSLLLPSVGFELPLAKVYRQIPELQGVDWEG